MNKKGFTTPSWASALLRRDQILEVEEKLYLGTLGSLRVEDRQAWQAAIQTRQYTMGAEELTWGGDGEAKRLTQDMLTVSRSYPNYTTFVIYTLLSDCSLTLIWSYIYIIYQRKKA